MAKKRASKPKRKKTPKRNTSRPYIPAEYRNPHDSASKRKYVEALIKDAYASPDPEQGYQFALAASMIDPFNLNALLFLSEFAPNLGERIENLERMIKITRDMYSRSPYKPGDSRHEIELDIFARMLLALAHAYCDGMEWDSAIETYREIVDLDADEEEIPARISLLPLLLQQHRFDQATALLDRFPHETSACWPYGRLLIGLQRGDSDESLRQLLDKCRLNNPYVAMFLVTDVPLPTESSEDGELDEREEAVHVARALLPAWQAVEGARQWLRRESASWPRFQPEFKLPESGELRRVIQTLRLKRNERWLVSLLQNPDADQPLWYLGITTSDLQEILHIEEYTCRPIPDAVAVDVLRFVVYANDSEIASRITTNQEELRNQLTGLLEPIKVKVDFKEFDLARQSRDLMLGIQASLNNRAQESELPQHAAPIWQLASIEMLETIYEHGEYFRPFATMLIETEIGTVLAFEIHRNRPTPDEQLAVVHKALRQVDQGRLPLPLRIEFRSPDELIDLQSPLNELGIHAVVGRDFTLLDELLKHFFEHFSGGGTLPAVTNIKGAKSGDLQDFFVAAAEFYKAKPWSRLPGDFPFEVSVASKKLTRYCTVMGQGGSTFGLSIFNNIDEFWAMMSSNQDPADGLPEQWLRKPSRDSRIWSVLYNEAHEISPHDLKAIEIQGWPVASIQAYPASFEVRKGKACSVKLPDLRANTFCLRAISHANREQLIRKAESQSITLKDGDVAFTAIITPIQMSAKTL